MFLLTVLKLRRCTESSTLLRCCCRLPPTGSFAEVTGRDAGDLSNSIGLQLYETAQARSTRAVGPKCYIKWALVGMAECHIQMPSIASTCIVDVCDHSNRVTPENQNDIILHSRVQEIVAGAGMHKYHQANASAVTSPTMASDDVAADTRASPTAPEPLGPADEGASRSPLGMYFLCGSALLLNDVDGLDFYLAIISSVAVGACTAYELGRVIFAGGRRCGSP